MVPASKSFRSAAEQERLAAAAAAAAETCRSEASSTVTSLSQWTRRSEADAAGQVAPPERSVVEAARQLIADLQTLLRDDCDLGAAGRGPSASAACADRAAPPQSPAEQPAPLPSAQPPQQRPEPSPRQQQQQQLLHLQACNGICVVFANFASFLPHDASAAAAAAAADARTATSTLDEDTVGSRRAGQIRDSVSGVGRLFNSQLEFAVLIHWNKTRGETLQLLRQAAAAMSEDGRDCCFAFFLGRGGRDHFQAACGGRVSLADVLATLAMGQRARLPTFVFGEVTETVAAAAASVGEAEESNGRNRLSLPSNQLLLWTLGAPQVTDMLVDQLARSHLSGTKDVASTVAGIAEWIRRRARESGCSCRFLSKLGRLVYLASPDCI